MTAGVVLATLVLNATTIRLLIRRLGLDQPDLLDRFVAAAARFDGARAARAELPDDRGDSGVARQLSEIERAAAQEIAGLGVSSEEIDQALLRRGLAVERAALQELVDHDLVPQWHARVALNALEDQLDELSMGGASERGLFEAHGLGGLTYAIARRIHLGRLTPEKWVELAYRDLKARLHATSAAISALEHFGGCPEVLDDHVASARAPFAAWHEKAERDLELLERTAPEPLLAAANRHYSTDLGRLASRRELRHLAELGLVSTVAVEHASELIAAHLRRAERSRIEVVVDADEDLGA
jgi:CPA1 family monovalent cation:H+ antiporter